MAEPENGLSRIRHDPEAFEAFYRRHVETVNRFVARRVDDPHTAADMTADVFIAVIDSAHTYRPSCGNEIGWLFGVARNVLAANRRRAGRELRANQRIAGRRLLDPDDIDRLVERIDAESTGRRTYQALADLPAGVRALLELIVVDGLTVTEAAAALDIRPVTARVRLHRARRVLRDVVSAQTPAMAYAKE
ncbi:RNA polymerase sigma factor [Actinomadura xylanilytica]|uniref:RNA polymerase sigma factor n=1 Tax=Actinomadura xylanilytica TaxID=887459 RepID=UPI00255A7E94|nr:sigma-70 family RNA polymerase sigma factor [Actinomadura xylanilytica]MDL4775774.1 sigma-70 family RNA polymerase sigma factor [Actinomadura xylanilytica]